MRYNYVVNLTSSLIFTGKKKFKKPERKVSGFLVMVFCAENYQILAKDNHKNPSISA
jgi:hypothetical protein